VLVIEQEIVLIKEQITTNETEIVEPKFTVTPRPTMMLPKIKQDLIGLDSFLSYS
jgi:hypothetical protein